MDAPVNSKQFVCIDYPGVVQNEKKMLSTIGGEATVTKIHNTDQARLELRFRPNDIYCKPAVGDRQSVTNLLLKVRRRKKRLKSTQAPEGTEGANAGSVEGDNYEYKAEVLGVIDTVYKFRGLADFQYLPMQPQAGGAYKSLYNDLCIRKLEKPEYLRAKDIPLHLPPSLFSRTDVPVEYNYRDTCTKRDDDKHTDNPNIIKMGRKRRPHYTLLINSNDWYVPTEPHPGAVTQFERKVKDKTLFAAVSKMFEKRPIWSKMALRVNTDPSVQVSPELWKFMLPVCSYYVVTGPWRRMWIKLGYDPKSGPEAKIYQVLDFRINQRGATDRLPVKFKRSSFHYTLPNKMQKPGLAAPVRIQYSLLDDPQQSEGQHLSQDEKDAHYKFYPGIIPAYRQMCYQYLDIEEPEVQRLIHINDGKETECTERDGWCLPDTTDKIRTIMARHVRDTLRRERERREGGTLIDQVIPRPSAQGGKGVRSERAAASGDSSDKMSARAILEDTLLELEDGRGEEEEEEDSLAEFEEMEDEEEEDEEDSDEEEEDAAGAAGGEEQGGHGNAGEADIMKLLGT